MPTGFSLHLGVDKYDQAAYRKRGQDIRPLPNCVRDAKAMAAIALQAGFAPAVLYNEEATRNHLIRGVETAAGMLIDGDILLLSFSGHGGIATDLNGDETCGFDQTWCLYDDEIIDDELYELWKLFRPGVRIVVVADSCHSGTCTKGYSWETMIHTPLPPNPKQDEVQATCLLLAACEDRQKTPAGKDHLSLYTERLVQKMAESRWRSYQALQESIRQDLPRSSRPFLFTFGPRADQLVLDKPFSI